MSEFRKADPTGSAGGQSSGEIRVDPLMIDAIRVLSMDAVQKANSGHPGTPMALAPVGAVLFARHLAHAPRNPEWMDRDRFVLSAGHASMLLYSLLHLTGYDLSLDDLKDFRQWGSKTPGHPEYHHTAGVETTTGPLGQGVTNSVGMAIAERWLATHVNRPGPDIVDHRTWAICSDGDLMEGISHEAAELAGHLGLDKLVWIFDDNRITIEGDTDLASSTDHEARFSAYGWRIIRVADGSDAEAVDLALAEAKRSEGRPTLIVLRTVIAEGSPNRAGHHSTHGAPLGDEEIEATKRHINYPSLEPFYIDPDARASWRQVAEAGDAAASAWEARFESYRAAHPELADRFVSSMAGDLPDGWSADLEAAVAGDRPMATRAASGKVLQLLAQRIPNMVGGSADLGPSNKTDIAGADDLSASTPGGRVVHFGVREHGMGGIMNGMALHGGILPFGGTFLIFSDYMRPSIRLASLMGLPTRYVFTHDSIGLGEDGPTHQPIEQLASLRAIPGLMDLRPADAEETAACWRLAMERADGPAFLSLTRQDLSPLPSGLGGSSGSMYERVSRGAYCIAEAEGNASPTVVIVATGSEVEVALEARSLLQAARIPTRVVSLPSWYLFTQQDAEYRARLLPEDALRVSVEAASTFGWERWVGARGLRVGIDHFGASAPSPTLFEEFGISGASVAALVTVELGRRSAGDE